MSNSLDSDQDRCSVGPVLGPNCLQRLTADKIIPTGKERVNVGPKMSAYYVCCIYSNALQTAFLREACSMKPDQTAHIVCIVINQSTSADDKAHEICCEWQETG